jgi:hypothetical protein
MDSESLTFYPNIDRAMKSRMDAAFAGAFDEHGRE